MVHEKIITIMVVVNVAKVLAHDTLDAHIYLYDNNRRKGSAHEGTDHLVSVVDFGHIKIEDQLVSLRWNIMALEPEAFVELSRVKMDERYVDVCQKRYEGSDVTYWCGTVKQPFDKAHCELFIKLGSHKEEFCHSFDFVGLNREE